MNDPGFCTQCGMQRVAGTRFCTSCGAPLAEPAPVAPAAPAAQPAQPAPAAQPAQPAPAGGGAEVRLGDTTFTWPVPDRSVNLNGRAMSLEIVLAAALYGIGALWLLISVHSAISVLPDLVSGLFGGALEFFISWLVLLVLTLVFYVIGLLAYTSYSLFRNDPVGRGLSTVITATLFLMCFGDTGSATVVLLTLISGACTVTLFLSPWARRAMDGERRQGRPWPVVLSQTLTFSFFVLTGLLGLGFLPGLRYADVVGAKVIVFVLFAIAGSGAAVYGAQLLVKTPHRRGRVLVSGAWAMVFVAELVAGSGSGTAITLALLCGGALPLWLAPSARRWFGDPPLALATAGPTS